MLEDKENTVSPASVTLSGKDIDRSVHTLVERMQTGMELKDLRTSEIITVYEHRLQSFQVST